MADKKKNDESLTGDPELDALLLISDETAPEITPEPTPEPSPPADPDTPPAGGDAPSPAPEVEPAPAPEVEPAPATPEPAAKKGKPAPEATLTPDQKRIRELEHQLAISTARKIDSAEDDLAIAEGEHKILIHFLIDGFTAQGRVWYRGQELEFDIPGKAFEDTKDAAGQSWLALNDAAQMERYGKVYFRRGPWPGRNYEDEQAAEAEKRRARAVPMPSVR